MSICVFPQAILLVLLAEPHGASGKCLCCRADQSTVEEGFCKWWSAKHDKVESLGEEAIGSDASEESQRLFIAYFRTHARLEDPIMWDLFRECPAFNATVHEPLLQANEDEENEIRMGLGMLANKMKGHETWGNLSQNRKHVAGSVVGLGQEGCSSKVGVIAHKEFNADWASVRAKVAAHTMSEERLLKQSGLLEACEGHLDRRWTEIMEKTHQDAQILYDEFRNMNLSLVQILKFVRGMVADWPGFPELRQRTALRMRQVRHEMPNMLDSKGTDILRQVNPGALWEYLLWIQLERTEGLEFNARDELSLHFSLLRRLLIVNGNCIVLVITTMCVLRFVCKHFGKKKLV